jgi:hypothetical protein
MKGKSRMFKKLWKYLTNLARNRKWCLFEKVFFPSPRALVLDISAGMGDMLEARYRWHEKIIAVDRKSNSEISKGRFQGKQSS